MPLYCAPCNRTFEQQEHLEQHLRLSRRHAKSLPTRLQPASAQSRGSQAQHMIHTSSNAKRSNPMRNDRLPLPKLSGASLNTPQTQIQMPVGGELLPPAPRWTSITHSEAQSLLDLLAGHSHSLKELEANRFLVKPYVAESVSHLPRKCTRCNARDKLSSRPRPVADKHEPTEENSAETKGKEDQQCFFHTSKRNKYNIKKPYKCCTSTGGKGCTMANKHDFQLAAQFSRYCHFRETPPPDGRVKARAVVLDCEMAGVVGNTTGEPILVCAIDYITGVTILNHYVVPEEPITQMRTDCHGVTYAALNDARHRGIALAGWEGARAELWKHIDEETILIGHALNNDLGALRMIHRQVVDSGILARSAAGKGTQCGLQALCSQLLRIEIRKNKKGIHDCMEDVFATREVVLFCTRRKDEFRAWAEARRAEQLQLEKEREKLRLEKEQAKEAENRKHEKATKDGKK